MFLWDQRLTGDAMYTRSDFFIGGNWAPPASTDLLDLISPATEKVIGHVPVATRDDIDAAVAAARSAFDVGEWPQLSVRERGEYLLAIAAELQAQSADMARLQTDEMGAPVTWIKAVTDYWLGLIDHDIDIAAAIPMREVRPGYIGQVVVYREPVGVVAGIIPWNGPVVNALTKVVPSLLTGCPIILKPAPESPVSAYMLADAAIKVGLPPGVFNLVPAGREIGEYLVSHPGVDRVSFTGSTDAGSQVAALCGRQLKSVTLELGGKSAAIVLEDADLDQISSSLINNAMQNTGQVCVATTRILVPRSRSEEIRDRLVSDISQMKIGDPQDADTVFGPLVAERQRKRVEGYIQSGREQGAKVLMGGGRPQNLPTGWYVEPTIFTDVDNSMRIAREEIFGPVICLFDYSDLAEALAIANDSQYGLGGAVYTSDLDRGIEVAAKMKTGSCIINEGPLGGGGGPFGGCKKSGLGRESGREGFEGYLELKSVALPAGSEPAA
jgi:aldehyde dehydrogenase (NAD+)